MESFFSVRAVNSDRVSLQSISGQVHDDAAPVPQVQVPRKVQLALRQGPDGLVAGQRSLGDPAASTTSLAQVDPSAPIPSSCHKSPYGPCPD